MEELKPDAGWQILMSTLVFPACVGLWKAYQGLMGRKDAQKTESMTREERMLKAIDDQRSAMTKDQMQFLDQIRAELVRTALRLKEIETERDELEAKFQNWQEIARGWRARSFDLRHDLGNARTVIDYHRSNAKLAQIIWLDEALPMTKGILQFNIDYETKKIEWRLQQKDQ